jgi:oxalate---CoA ligase
LSLLSDQALTRWARADRDDDGPFPSIGDRIALIATAHPERLALLSTGHGALTYAELMGVILEVQARLRREGLGPSARVGVLGHSPVLAALIIAALSCSATAVPLDSRLPERELARTLEQLELDALVLLSEDAGATGPGLHLAPPGLQIVPPGVQVLPWTFRRGSLDLGSPRSAPGASLDAIDPDAPAFILRTSGTTAQPKLIPFSHRNMVEAAERWASWFRLTPEDRSLCVSAPYYSHGLKVSILIPLLTGGSVVFPASATDVDLHEWFEVLRPTWYSAGPALHRAVLEAAKARPNTVLGHELRFASSGGARLPAFVRDEFPEHLGIPVLEHYGSSEAAQAAVNTPEPGGSRAGTVGRPWPGTLVIMGQDGDPAETGERGEVYLRGPTIMNGYLGDPALNAQAFSDEWFRTGDLGSLDADGFLTLHGRTSEIINRGGEKISPQEIDEVMVLHPGVEDAAAFRIPHPRLGEDVAAAIVVRPGAAFDIVAFREFLRRELVAFKVPQQILLVERLPRGITGKILRQQLTMRASDPVPASATPARRDEEITALEQALLPIWQRLLKQDDLSIHDSFRQAGGDSLLAVVMLGAVEKRLGRTVPEAILSEVDTVRELADALARGAEHVGPVLEFNAGAAAPPLFWFHGDFVYGGYYVRRFARLLGPSIPLVCIAPHGVLGDRVPGTVEAMAADRLALITKRQPSGPYRLGGYCNGALIAFEVARQLLLDGQGVELVALVDPPGINSRPLAGALLAALSLVLPGRLLATVYDRLTEFEREERWPLLKRYALRLLGRESGRDPALASVERSETRIKKVQYSVAMSKFRPRYLLAPVLFFQAGHDSGLWRRLCRSLELLKVPGGHELCVREHAASIVEPLRRRIQPDP